ncbi:MAG: hypothetical protein ACOYMD_05980 [Paludibacter sp.]
MRYCYHFVIFLIICGLSTACNNDFLSNNTEQTFVNDTLIFTDLITDTVVQFGAPGCTNQSWKIIAYPHWLKLSDLKGTLNNGKCEISLHRLEGQENSDFNVLYNQITVMVENVGRIQIPIIYGRFGKPIIEYNNSTIKFNNDYFTQTTFSNTGGGIWFWRVTQKPDWIILSQESGILNPYNDLTLKIEIDRSKLIQSKISSSIIINGNGSERIIVLEIEQNMAEFGFSGNIMRIDGNVMTAEYNKATDNIMLLTQNPNRLIFVNAITRTINTIEPKGIPTCATFSEDGKTVLIGKAIAEIDIVDVEKQLITKTIPIDVDAKSIIYGNNGWAYVSTTERNRGLRSVNLVSGKYYHSLRNNLQGDYSIIKKAPGKPLLFSTDAGYTPSNLYVWDISKGIVKDTVDKYSIDAGNMWFSEDGSSLFLKQQQTAYNTPDYKNGFYGVFNSSLDIKSNFSLNSTSYQNIYAFDHNALTNKFWAAYILANGKNVIAEFDATKFSKIKDYSIQSIIDISGKSYDSYIYWLFSVKNGKTLYYVKRTQDGYGNPSNWQLEKVTL